MDTKQRIETDMHVLKTYITEHGQAVGKVSWQMAQHAYEEINDFIEHTFAIAYNKDLSEETHTDGNAGG